MGFVKEPVTSAISPVEWGASHLTFPGEAHSGDVHLVAPLENGVLLGAVDGLGHGEEAAAAAGAALAILEAHRAEPIVSLIERCHRRLVGTRGVVMTLAAYDARRRKLSWLGVGNVEAVLLRADPFARPPQETLLLRGGVVGYHLPPLQSSVVPVFPHDTVVLATDGVRSDFATGVTAGAAPQEMADRILSRYVKGSDDAVVLVVRFAGAGP